MADAGQNHLTKGGEPGSGMDCLQLRQPPGPFHYLINEQAKSLVALQELQHEVGALLEFRDLVIETFPNLRTKMAAHTSASSPATMTSNIPVAVRRADWEPGVRVRRKLHHVNKDEVAARTKKADAASSGGAIQDSGFSTETSSKETHSAHSSSSTALAHSASAAHADEAEDELWHLLDVIHLKGTRLKDEVEALAGALRDQNARDTEEIADTDDGGDFQRVLFHASADDVRQLRRDRDVLLDRVAEMEAEVLAGRVHTCRLQEDLANLLTAKQDLEEQLRNVLNNSGEVNSRIHDMHLQFVAPTPAAAVAAVVATGTESMSGSSAVVASTGVTPTDAVPSHQQRTHSHSPRTNAHLDNVLGSHSPKVALPDSRKIAAILKEYDPIVLQKHLLTSTVQNQVLQLQLETASRLEQNLVDKLDKAREENDDLRFQLEDRNIELEGTRARVRMLENIKKPPSGKSPDIIPALDTTAGERTEIGSPSMKAMSPYPPLNLLQMEHSSSTESAHDQAESARTPRRRPSKIPLGTKTYAAPKPPTSGGGGKHSPAPRSRSGGSPGRPHSAQSWRKSEANSLSGNNNKSRNGSLITGRESLSRSAGGGGGARDRDVSVLTTGTGTSYTSSTLGVRAGSTPTSVVGHRKSAAPGTPARRNNSIRESPDSKIANRKKTWMTSALSASYPSGDALEVVDVDADSLDHRTNLLLQRATGLTANARTHFYWNLHQESYYDSIDSNRSSSMYQAGEELAECDSLEKQLSNISCDPAAKCNADPN